MNTIKNNNEFEYSVTEISNSIKQTIELNFEYVHVAGEISSVKVASSGHVYFDLKDSKSVINTIAWKFVAQKLTVFPEEGQQVVVTGKITTYPGRSNYQLIVKDIKKSGEGDIFKLIEERKKKFKELGYFDEAIKKPLKKYPSKIGIITSKTGAVIEDIKHRISERFPCELYLYNSTMQGSSCENDVVNGIKLLNEINDIDLIIIARGGGSIEDFMPFNGELLCEEIYKSKHPIISAVGHETDFTICDFVSDLRAPTPTAASEICTPNRNDLFMNLQSLNEKSNFIMSNKFTKIEAKINKFKITSLSFMNKFTSLKDKFKKNEMILSTVLEKQIFSKNIKLQNIFSKLQSPNHILKLKQKHISSLHDKLQNNITKKISFIENKVHLHATILDNTSHNKIMSKGYCIINDENGKIVKDISLLNKNDTIKIINNQNNKNAKITD